MRYIKTFESIEYFKKISEETFCGSVFNNPDYYGSPHEDSINRVKFMQDNWMDVSNDVSMIKKYLLNSNIDSFYVKKCIYDYSIKQQTFIDIYRPGYVNIKVYHLKDDWYYVDDLAESRQYYKCDQFDGLLQYINKIIENI